MSKSLVLEKAIKFALRIVKLYRYPAEDQREYVLSKQILLSGTHIAKFIKDATQAESKPAFSGDMQIDIKTNFGNGILAFAFTRRRFY